jgi:large subunit ribosomal protein L15
MPFKRGFTNIWRVEYQVVNVEDLQNWPAGVEVTLETLLAARLIRRKAKPVKLLGEGELSNALTVRVHKASGSARQKIEAAGGTIEELPYVVPRRSRSQGANPRPRKSKVDA